MAASTGRRLRWVTVATESRPALQALAWSGAACGMPRLEVWVPPAPPGGGPRPPWTFGMKLRALAAAVGGDAPPDDLLLFTDAYDVLLLAGAAEFVRVYEAASAGAGQARLAAPVLFSTEDTCWPPDAALAAAYPAAARARAWPYLNSGVLLGPVGSVRALLAGGGPWTEATDDQAYFGGLFVAVAAGSRPDLPPLLLDHDNALAVSMLPLRDGPGAGGVAASPAGRVTVAATGGNPLVLHFNGQAKHRLGPYLGWLRSVHGHKARSRERERSAAAAAAAAATVLAMCASLQTAGNLARVAGRQRHLR